MFIKYSNSNIHAFGTPDGKEIFWLRPGWNEFPKRIWDMYKDHEDVKAMLEAKTIELLSEKVEVPSKGKKKLFKQVGMDDSPVNLKEISENKAIEIVKATYDRKILERWLDEDTRHKVKRALDAQIKPLLPENQSQAG